MEPNERPQSSDITALFDFSFSRFVTVDIVKFLYALILVLIAIGWLIGVISGFSQGFLAGLGMLLVVTLIAAIEVIFARVVLEVIVVLFRISENTSRLAERDPAGRVDDPAGPPSTHEPPRPG